LKRNSKGNPHCGKYINRRKQNKIKNCTEPEKGNNSTRVPPPKIKTERKGYTSTIQSLPNLRKLVVAIF
jgi:hypothetical protein